MSNDSQWRLQEPRRITYDPGFWWHLYAVVMVLLLLLLSVGLLLTAAFRLV
jgi:hypothetical protein